MPYHTRTVRALEKSERATVYGPVSRDPHSRQPRVRLTALALAITGGFRTSPLDALDAYAALLPMHLRIGKVKYRMAVRMASLPPTHPLHKHLRVASRRRVQRHRAPLHSVAERLALDPDAVETIPVAKTNPALRGNLPFLISIAQSKEQSKREDGHAKEEIKVVGKITIHI